MSKTNKNPRPLSPEKFCETVDAHEQRSAGKLPRRAVAALLPSSRKVHGIELHPATFATLIVLEKIQHPILSTDQAKLTLEDAASLAYSFAHPAEAYSLLMAGAESLRLEVFKWAETISVAAIKDLATAAGELYAEAFSTVISSSSGQTRKTESEGADPFPSSRRQPPG